MKKKILPYLVIIVISVIAGILINTKQSLNNVSACVRAPGCVEQDKQPIGKLTTNNYGFPATYKQVITFEPANSNEKASNYAGYASASAETKSTSVLHIVINVLFWAAVLFAGYSLAKRLKTRA